MTAFRQRLVDNIVSAEARLNRAEENTERNVAARGGWDNISDDDRRLNERTLGILRSQVDLRYRDLDEYDAKQAAKSCPCHAHGVFPDHRCTPLCSHSNPVCVITEEG